MSEEIKKGGISVETKNIFPVIKKWLYSDKDIFVRELVSNACDAITKHKRLASLGETEADSAPYRVDVTLDNDLGTLTFSDNGIGMNAEEIDKYINQIALSGAVDFIRKYESTDASAEKTENTSGIIGHFGLGFYSAFMIADTVEIHSKSWHDDKAVRWKGSDDGDYEMGVSDERPTRGTDIILHINEDEKSYANAYKIKEILEKFCAFMPVEIYFTELPEKEEEPPKDGEKPAEKQPPKPVNDTHPLWLKRPQDCTEDEYKEFYRKVFADYREPLFWVHINADYPLNFKGILYFPKMENEFGNYEGQVKLFYNQVFVADNIKEVIPEYLLLLKGVIDCPELPLNVSRSYLQTNGYVSKISAHIVKKVGDKINSLFNTEREKFEGMWDDVKLFAEYGSVRDQKFFEKIKDSILYKTTVGKYVTLAEYAEASEHFDKKVYYTDDKKQQAAYISMFDKQNVPIVELDKLLDIQFVGAVEHADYGEKLKDVKFVRVDSGVSDILKEENGKKDDKSCEKLAKFFEKTLAKGEHLKFSGEALKDASVPAVLNLSEESRRFADMMKMYGSAMNGSFPQEMTLVLNLSNSLTEKLAERVAAGSEDELSEKLAKQIYMLALVAQRPLEAEELSEFISLSSELYTRL